MQLRDYQQQAVNAAISHFQQRSASAVLVLPTGAGKSIVIAELARRAKGRVLILTHVKELVAQNAEKVAVLTAKASIYAAGLQQKDASAKTVVASVQSAVRNLDAFASAFSLVIIDECHRVSLSTDSQYQQLLSQLKQHNPEIKLLGLTATPFRLGSGWIYRQHYHGRVGNTLNPTFEYCIFDLPLRPLIKQGYLTTPRLYDGLSAQYDFSSLKPKAEGDYTETEVNSILGKSGRATALIMQQLITLATQRQGIIVFAATVKHANEIMQLLSQQSAAILTAETPIVERDQLIDAFKNRQIKFLVNVAVLTTGFDAPHVDLIAILRPTASVSLFQQMVGRGLRIAAGKTECLIIDYAANGYDLFSPEVGQAKPNSSSVPVQVLCPECGFANIFWGLTDQDGDIIEHYGRRCQGLIEDTAQQCQYRYRSRNCPECGAENDIAARSCQQCESVLVDPDKRLREVLNQQHHHLFRCHNMQLSDDNGDLKVSYYDIEGNPFYRWFKLQNPAQRRALFALFIKPHSKAPGTPLPTIKTAAQLVALAERFRPPQLILLQKQKHSWQHVESYFDYQGRYQQFTEQ
ncbi:MULTISPECIES: DEAD/DEAH box helicase family protein [unclassified Alishewanella]|uniref:DEAD/DEAH box helicase family protein n=1 Tax=unclassified Alishewanella TaxID=2628974 RepID=UPI0040438EF2